MRKRRHAACHPSSQMADERHRDGWPTTEHTAAGEQHTIPGAERISSTELVKRRAAEPLKPKAKQRPADHGLFSDESKQTDLVDRANARDI